MLIQDVIPILTLGEQAPVREVLWQQASPYAGRILVRDVQDTSASEEAAPEGAPEGSPTGAAASQTKRKAKKALARKEKDKGYQRLMRQLLFSCNPNTLQSEVKVRFRV